VTLVTVAVPAWRPDHLGEALEGALAQSLDDMEVLVSDDASPHGIAEVRGPRVRFVRQPANLGYPRHVRWLIENARGKYVIVLCDDDFWRSDVLAAQAALLERTPGMLLACTGSLFWEPDRGVARALLHRWPEVVPTEAFFRSSLWDDPTIALSSAMFRRDAALAMGLWGDPSLRYSPDLEAWLALALAGPVGYLNRTSCVTRLHGRQLTHEIGAVERLADVERVAVRTLARAGVRRELVAPWLARKLAYAFAGARLAGAPRGELAAVYERARGLLRPPWSSLAWASQAMSERWLGFLRDAHRRAGGAHEVPLQRVSPASSRS